MFNSVVLIGRAVDVPNVKTLDSGMVVGNFTLAVGRPYKNLEGNYDTDFIVCTCWNSVAMSAAEYIKKGSLICVKALLITKDDTYTFTTEQNESISRKIKALEVSVERVIYLKL